MNCDFFRDVSNECIIRLVHSFKFAVFLAHDVLAEEGELAAELVFLIHGSAKVTKVGKSMPVSLLSPGDYFGEKSLLMHHRNAISVIATENCDTRVLDKDDFEDLTIDFPELRDSILKRSDHMDVTEYDSHTRRQSIVKKRVSTRRKSEILNLNNLHNTWATREGKPKKEETSLEKAGAFSFLPAPPPPLTQSLKASSKDTESFTKKSRMPEIQSDLANMTNRIDVLASNQSKIQDSLKCLESKLDRLLSQQSG